MKRVDIDYLRNVSNVESIYAFLIADKPHFIGWGEETSSGRFRVFKHAFEIPQENLACENLSSAITNTDGWNDTVSYCGLTTIDEFYLHVSGYAEDGENPVIFSLSVDELETVITYLKNDAYIFIIKEEERSIV